MTCFKNARSCLHLIYPPESDSVWRCLARDGELHRSSVEPSARQPTEDAEGPPPSAPSSCPGSPTGPRSIRLVSPQAVQIRSISDAAASPRSTTPTSLDEDLPIDRRSDRPPIANTVAPSLACLCSVCSSASLCAQQHAASSRCIFASVPSTITTLAQYPAARRVSTQMHPRTRRHDKVH